MSKPLVPTLPEFIIAIDSAWQDLLAFLSTVTPSEALARDDAGWTVKDHVTHLAVWEDSVAVLFRGGARHEALGIDELVYAGGDFDQINEAIKERFPATSLTQAIQQLQQAHAQLTASLQSLADADLKTTVRDFFPQAPRTDDRPMTTIIWDNSAGHFNEHLEWLRVLIGRAA